MGTDFSFRCCYCSGRFLIFGGDSSNRLRSRLSFQSPNRSRTQPRLKHHRIKIRICFCYVQPIIMEAITVVVLTVSINPFGREVRIIVVNVLSLFKLCGFQRILALGADPEYFRNSFFLFCLNEYLFQRSALPAIVKHRKTQLSFNISSMIMKFSPDKLNAM